MPGLVPGRRTLQRSITFCTTYDYSLDLHNHIITAKMADRNKVTMEASA